MMNLIILAVMTITLMGAATYGLVGAMRSLQTSIETLVIQDRLEEAAQGVIANIAIVPTNTSVTYYVPAPDVTTNPTVPSWITPNAQTPRGVKFLYCPYSNVTATGTTTLTTPTGSSSGTYTSLSYKITTGTLYAGVNISSNNYVTTSQYAYIHGGSPGTSSRPPNQSTALAVLVAPGPGESALLATQDCFQVTATGTLPGASVRVITEQEVQSKAQVTAATGNEFYAANSATGDGKGTSTSNFAAFSTIMDYVNKYRPQRVTVNLKSGDSITVNSANMDQTSVATRDFTSIRNHSIYFNGLTSGTSLVTGTAGTLSPVIIGTSYFNNVLFPTVAGQLYRPVAQSFGNVILNNSTSLGYAQAENLGKVLIVGNSTLIGATATSATGKEMFYAERGGLIRVSSAATLTGPAQGYTTNSLFYSEFGGGISIDGTIALSGGNTSTTSPFNAGGDGWLSISGAITGPASGAPHNETSEIYNDTASRTYEVDTSSGFYNPEVYNQGGLYVVSGLFGSGTLLPINSTLSTLWSAGPGASFGISSNAVIGNSTHRPTTEALYSNSATQNYFTYLTGGNSVIYNGATSTLGLYGSNTGTTQCLSDLAAFNPAFGAGNTSGAALAPTGNIGMEAAIILNRTSATCN